MKAKLDDASIVALRSLLKIMKSILEEIDALDRHIGNPLAEFGSDVDLLLTVPGVGSKATAVILAEIGDIKRFPSA